MEEGSEDKTYAQLERADRLRESGHPEAAAQIMRDLGFEEDHRRNPNIDAARKLLQERRPQAFYDLVKAGALTRTETYELRKIVDAIPEEREVLDQVLALTRPEDMNADWFGGPGPTGPDVQVVG